MNYNIVTDEKSSRVPCEDVSIGEGEEIARILLNVLQKTRDAAGLAANHLGINKKVCVVNVAEPLYFINPVICSSSGQVIFNEGCLSFPNENVITRRHRIIGVKTDNFKDDFRFFTCENNILECICVQHEIDHLYGITMFDGEAK